MGSRVPEEEEGERPGPSKKMFVSETSTLNLMGSNLKVLSGDGHWWEGQPDLSMKISEFKQMLVQYFYPEGGRENHIDFFRIMSPGQNRTLQDSQTLEDENVKPTDLLMLLRLHVGLDKDEVKVEPRVPTAEDIEIATQHLSERESKTEDTNSVPGTSVPRQELDVITLLHEHHGPEFQTELRKIIISLVSVMALLQEGDQETLNVCRQLQKRLRRRLFNVRKPIEGSTFTYPDYGEVECSPLGILAAIAEVRKREFRPHVRAVEELRKMGYKDEQIIVALRKAKNSTEKAIDIITSGELDTPDIDETGLDESSHLYTALVTSSTIRLGMMNPKIMLAFLNILDGSSPTATSLWLNDSETSPVISTIFKIYHAEKHVTSP